MSEGKHFQPTTHGRLKPSTHVPSSSYSTWPGCWHHQNRWAAPGAWKLPLSPAPPHMLWMYDWVLAGEVQPPHADISSPIPSDTALCGGDLSWGLPPASVNHIVHTEVRAGSPQSECTQDPGDVASGNGSIGWTWCLNCGQSMAPGISRCRWRGIQ